MNTQANDDEYRFPYSPVITLNMRHARALGLLAARASNPACPYTDADLIASWRDGYEKGREQIDSCNSRIGCDCDNCIRDIR